MRDITKWLERKLGPSLEASRGDELRVCCPLCEDEGYHLYYNPTKNLWLCFRCNATGAGLDLVMEVDGVDALTAAKVLAPSIQRPPKPVKELHEMPAWYVPLLQAEDHKAGWQRVYDYTLARGFSAEQVAFYGFGYAVGNYDYRGRLIIPVERGYFQARATTSTQKPKYVNPDVPKGNRLFNYRFLGASRLAVCEGCISAIKATAKPGDPPALAVLGKAVTREQAKRIADARPEVVDIAFDAGTETSDPTLEFADYLHSRDIWVNIRAYKFGDPDECSKYDLYSYSPTYKLKARLDRIR